jgi:hypothetical protein
MLLLDFGDDVCEYEDLEDLYLFLAPLAPTTSSKLPIDTLFNKNGNWPSKFHSLIDFSHSSGGQAVLGTRHLNQRRLHNSSSTSFSLGPYINVFCFCHILGDQEAGIRREGLT